MIANGAYWVHCFAVLLFLNFLPLGKHFHVITGIPNVFFRSLTPYGQVAKMEIDLEDEDPSFGMRSTADLSWKMVLDTYSCTECGRCTVYCPTVLTDKPLAHRALNLSIKDAVSEDLETLTGGDASRRLSFPTWCRKAELIQKQSGPAQPVVHASKSVRSSSRTCRVLFKCVSTKS